MTFLVPLIRAMQAERITEIFSGTPNFEAPIGVSMDT